MNLQIEKLYRDPHDPHLDQLVGAWTYNPTESRIRERINRHLTNHKLYKASEEGSLIGAFAIGLEDDKWELTGLAVREDLRGQGFGRRIIKEISELIGPENSLLVETDESAVKFYRNCGFVELKTWTLEGGIRRFKLELQNRPVTKGQKTAIRKAIPGDAAQLLSWYRDGELMKHVGFPLGLEISEEQIENLLENQPAGSCRFLILDEDQRAVGECNYKKMTAEACEIGIKICDLSLHRKGYGSDALEAFLSYLFGEFGLKTVRLTVLGENAAARSLYEKTGFGIMSIDRAGWTDPSGKIHDVVHMEIHVSTTSL